MLYWATVEPSVLTVIVLTLKLMKRIIVRICILMSMVTCNL